MSGSHGLGFLFFFGACCILAQIVILGNLLADISFTNLWFKERHTFLSYMGLLVSTFPNFALFYWVYPQSKLHAYNAKFTYSKNYI